MPDMDLDSTPSRLAITNRMAWIVASLSLALGSWLIGQGAWIHIKAEAAQWLLQKAWQQTLTRQEPVKPWPWADTWPVGQLIIPRLGIKQIILADASGQSLAFGPGRLANGGYSDDDWPSLILSGHRDTHFSFLQDLQPGDTITVQSLQGDWRNFLVNNREIMDSRVDRLTTKQETSDIRLVTCYPFDAILPGGPLRFVVNGELKKREETMPSLDRQSPVST